MSKTTEQRQTQPAVGAGRNTGKGDALDAGFPPTTPDNPWRSLGGAYGPEQGAYIELFELSTPLHEPMREKGIFLGMDNGHVRLDQGSDWRISRRYIRPVFWRRGVKGGANSWKVEKIEEATPENGREKASLRGGSTRRIVEVNTRNGNFLVADTSTITMSDLADEFLVFDRCVCDGSFSSEICRPPSGERVSIRTSAIESVVFLADNAEGDMNSGVRLRRRLLLHGSEGINADSGD